MNDVDMTKDYTVYEQVYVTIPKKLGGGYRLVTRPIPDMVKRQKRKAKYAAKKRS